MKRLVFLVLAFFFFWGMGLTSPIWAAYSAHQDDTDINNFLKVYPSAKSTKLDDCALCHTGGTIGKNTYGSWDYCHQTYGLQAPHGDIRKTLNPYGLDYLTAGGHPANPASDAARDQADQAAVKAIDGRDSDGDGYLNGVEIQALTYPGNKADYPGLLAAPAIALNLERLFQLPDHSEFLLLNASKDQDWYARYRGVKIIDLLRYAGAGKGVTGITVFSPDGFSKYFPFDVPDPQTDPSHIQYDVMGPYPYGTYYGGLDFVSYAFYPVWLLPDNRIPDKLYMLLAYLRDGDPLTPGKIDPTTLKLNGEGPYRLIPPQKIAGGPDRPSTAQAVGDGWDYSSSKDHNAGSSVRTVAAIRVEPLPSGTTDFAWTEGGWNLVDQAKLVIYGAIDPRTYPIVGKVVDSSGQGIANVKITFGLLSLGQVGEATTSSTRFGNGKFKINLPAGEYALIPSKDGCTFTPGSLSISFSDPEYSQRHYWEYHPEQEITFTGSCK